MAGMADTFTLWADVSESVTHKNVMAPALGGLAAGLGARVAGLRGGLRTGAQLASLGALGFAALGFYRNYQQARAASQDTGVARAGKIVGTTVATAAERIVDDKTRGGQPGDSDMVQVLQNYSCYENARRAKASASWLDTVLNRNNAIRNPLLDCGLTAAQAAVVKSAFDKISRADRARLAGAYRPGQSLEDLGPGA